MAIERIDTSLEKKFENIPGFTKANLIGKGEPSTIEEYEAQGLTGAEPGKWAQNNGTIALVTSSGEICVWIPKPDTTTPRTVSYDQAIRSLEEAGYAEGHFYVPHSNN